MGGAALDDVDHPGLVNGIPFDQDAVGDRLWRHPIHRGRLR
jgi:hypothetical protein